MPNFLLRSLSRLKKSILKKRLFRFLRYLKDFSVFRASLKKTRGFDLLVGDMYPCLNDRTASTGFDRHYIYHTAWAARVVRVLNPELHVDIGSLLYFPCLVSAFVPVEYFDYRPAGLMLAGMSSGHADLSALAIKSDSVVSLSCMHVVEHIGLGRYGDPIDPDGDLRAMHELRRVLAPGGNLLFVVPVGRARVCFNAHRVYSYSQVLAAFEGLLLKEFSLIPDGPDDGLLTNADPRLVEKQNYACGCFWFCKPVR